MNPAVNLILTGFMGTGKTAVGREVAARLGRQFVDTDQLIEQRVGRSIPDIFERNGEAAFRAMEADVCRELNRPRGLVIATGGWTLGDPDNRATLEAGGRVICLRTDARTLIERLGSAQGRPMLHDPNWPWRLRALLALRMPTYLSFPFQVNTSRLTIGQAADRVLGLWEILVQLSDPDNAPLALPVVLDDTGYSVLISNGALDWIGVLAAALGRPTGAAIISDSTVAPLYAQRVAAALERAAAAPTGAAGLATPLLATMPAGETHKTLSTVTDLYAQMLAGQLDRGALVLALGGGVVGDVAGFAAATYMRGLALVQLPTTLLAMVDSSVGGKTGVDLPIGKNLVGAFKQPELVVVDPSVLSTLPTAEVRAGLAEIVKAGVIGDPTLFERLDQGRLDDVAWLIQKAVAVKIEVVQSDPFEQGRRAVLNLGHTFGHALEMLSDFQLRHGEAVAIGMVTAARLAVRLGRCQIETATRIETTLCRLGLPTTLPGYPPEAIWAAMASDKKKQGNRLRFILPTAIGRVEIYDDVPRSVVLEVLTGS
jgi:shikimate kinase/3-dehydroquinate synthase